MKGSEPPQPEMLRSGTSHGRPPRPACLAALAALAVGIAAAGAGRCGDAGEPAYAAAAAAVRQRAYGRAERLLTARLAHHPDDVKSRALRARVRSWSREWPGALRDYDTLLKTEPRNADYLLGKAQVLLWSGSPRKAAAVAQTGRRLAPGYEALWKVELQALLASGGAASRQAAVTLAAAARHRFPASVWNVPPARAPESYLEIAATAGHEHLSHGFADWSSRSVRTSYHFADGRIAYGGVRTTQRFGIPDTAFDGGVSMPMGARWVGTADLSASPTGDVLPEYSVALGGTRSLQEGWGVGVNARYSRYSSTYARQISVSLERYWRKYRFSYARYRTDTGTGHPSSSGALRVDYYYGGSSSVGALIARGTEIESVGAGRLIRTSVDAATLLGRQRLAENWLLTWSATRHRQGNVYQRSGLNVGFEHRF